MTRHIFLFAALCIPCLACDDPADVDALDLEAVAAPTDDVDAPTDRPAPSVSELDDLSAAEIAERADWIEEELPDGGLMLTAPPTLPTGDTDPCPPVGGCENAWIGPWCQYTPWCGQSVARVYAGTRQTTCQGYVVGCEIRYCGC